MNSPRVRRLVWTGACALACLISVACDKTSPRLKWNLKTLVKAYEKGGHTNPKWDESAKRCLTEFARVRAQCTTSNENASSLISDNSIAAVNAGCNDPMVRYLYVRNMAMTQTSQELATALCQVAADVENSSYPGIRKFYAWQRAAQQVTAVYGYGTNIPPELDGLGIWSHAESDLLNALSDPTMPPEEAYDPCHELLETWKGDAQHYSSLYHSIEGLFPNDWTNAPLILLLKGESYIDMAWQARGYGFADSITSGGAKLFAERLAVAENNLTNAWAFSTNDPRIAVKMMTVELGQGQGRERMELWFHRAMDADPNNYDACDSKLRYLRPEWYGSVVDMLAFGRECVQNEQWRGHIPLILMDAHVAIQRQIVADTEKDGYWKQPAVWHDLKSAFDRFFELNPQEISWYHNYIWFAYQAEDWAAVNASLPKMGPVNYTYFGGKDSFDAMVARAQVHAGKTKPKD